MNKSIGKAGRIAGRAAPAQPRRRHEPGRPSHGGGEGRTKGGRHPVTPWGKPTKGAKTRKNKRRKVHRALAPRPKKKQGLSHDAFVWKGPFVDGYLLKKAEAARVRPQGRDQDLVAPLDHPAAVRRPDLRRLQRPQAHSGDGHRGHGRPQVRRVLADPHFHGHAADKKAKRAKRWARKRRARVSRTNEGDGQGPHACASPRKLNLVAQLDPRQEGRAGAQRAEFSPSASPSEVQEGLSRRSPMPRTTTTSTSTIWSSPRPASARTW
jgi:hypothetical protein